MEFYVKSIVVAPNKSAIFNTFSSSEFWFLENFTLEYCTILWTSNFVSSEIVKNDRFWTDLCSLHNLEYTGFFYVPLRFYVKSSLVILIFEAPKLPFWTIEQLWILIFWELMTSSSVQFVQK